MGWGFSKKRQTPSRPPSTVEDAAKPPSWQWRGKSREVTAPNGVTHRLEHAVVVCRTWRDLLFVIYESSGETNNLICLNGDGTIRWRLNQTERAALTPLLLRILQDEGQLVPDRIDELNDIMRPIVLFAGPDPDEDDGEFLWAGNNADWRWYFQIRKEDGSVVKIFRSHWDAPYPQEPSVSTTLSNNTALPACK